MITSPGMMPALGRSIARAMSAIALSMDNGIEVPAITFQILDSEQLQFKQPGFPSNTVSATLITLAPDGDFQICIPLHKFELRALAMMLDIASDVDAAVAIERNLLPPEVPVRSERII